jgi:hypothetical protein
MSTAPVAIDSDPPLKVILLYPDVTHRQRLRGCMKLKDKVALVTGTSPNIGGGITEGLAAEGASLVVLMPRLPMRPTAQSTSLAPAAKAIGITCDVTDEVQVAATVRKAFEAFQRHRQPNLQVDRPPDCRGFPMGRSTSPPHPR